MAMLALKLECKRRKLSIKELYKLYNIKDLYKLYIIKESLSHKSS